MNIVEYWNEKTALLEDAFEGWQKKEEMQIRKLIISQMMSIPEDEITFYLKRNSWYLKFVLGDTSELDRAFVMNESTKEKVQKIIEEYFYRKDYEILCVIRNGSVSTVSVEKNLVCECIKALVEDTIYRGLNKHDREIVDTLEKIYFDPVELFNEYVEESAGSETYYTILMEQWKTANEMAANISEQRNNMNNFYMSLMSILVGGVLFSNQLPDTNILIRSVLYVAVLIIGTVCCNKWIAQIDNYGKLNGEKYNVINALERKLPANVMLCEYLHTEKTARRNNEKISFSKQEKDIAKLFRFVLIAVSALMLAGAWGEYIWLIIRK